MFPGAPFIVCANASFVFESLYTFREIHNVSGKYTRKHRIVIWQFTGTIFVTDFMQDIFLNMKKNPEKELLLVYD